MNWIKQYMKDGAYILLTTIGLGVSAALVALIVERPERWVIILQFMGLLLSWPVIVLVLTLYLVNSFRQELSALIAKLKRGKVPGLEFETEQQPFEKPPEPDTPPEDTLAKDDHLETAKEFIESLKEQLKGTKEEKEQIIQAARNQIQQWTEAAAHWRFEYLDRFLVPVTKLILNLIDTNPLSPSDVNVLVGLWHPDPQQGAVIQGVLLGEGLAVLDQSNRLTITDFGKHFLERHTWKYGKRPDVPPLPNKTSELRPPSVSSPSTVLPKPLKRPSPPPSHENR